jgi:hypothetical protein
MWLNVVVGCAMAYRRWMGAVLTATTPAGPRNKREPTPENYRVPVYIFHINLLLRAMLILILFSIFLKRCPNLNSFARAD